MLGRLVSMIALAGLCLVPATAAADVVFPPPDDCPEGSIGQRCHGPEWCSPRECTNDDECGQGETCQTVDLCILVINCGGGYGEILEDNVMGPCDGQTCVGEAKCEARSVCLPEGNGTTGGTTTSTSSTTDPSTTDPSTTAGTTTGDSATTDPSTTAGTSATTSPTTGASDSAPQTDSGGGDGDGGSDSGCGCSTPPSSAAAWSLVLLGFVRRRR